MPELPEVEHVARGLRAALSGSVVRSVTGRFPGVLLLGRGVRASAASGRRVEAVRRRGKLLLLDLEGDLTLSVHLRMTGELSLVDPRAPLRPHTHVLVDFEDGRQLRFCDPRRFGRVELRTRSEHENEGFAARLGPEPFDLDAEGLGARLRGSRAGLKARLLDQGVVAGLGNIYVDEILHASGLHPGRSARSLRPGEVLRLHAAMIRILEDAIRAGGSTISDYRGLDGRAGDYQRRHRVFGREGLPCPACGTAIVKTRVAGRGTHHCPRCQVRPRARRHR